MDSAIEDNVIDLWEDIETSMKQNITRFKDYSPRGSRDIIIPLGCEDPEFSTGLKTLNLGKTGVCVLTSGGSRGVGKTVNTVTYFLDVLDTINMHRFMVDPKWEIWYRKNQNYEFSSILNRLNNQSGGVFNLKPRGHENMVRITPAALYRKEIMGSLGEITQLKVEDLTYDDLLTMLGLDPTTHSDFPLIERVDQVVFDKPMDDLLIETSSTLGGFSSLKIKPIEKIVKNLKEKNDIYITRKFQSLLIKQAIGNGKIPYVPVLDYLSKGATVVFQTAFGKNNAAMHPILAAYVGKMLRDIIKDRDNFVKGERDIKLHYPISLYFGEYDVYYPANKKVSTIDLIDSIYDNLRYAGVYLWADSAHFHTIKSNAIEQSDFIFCFKPNRKDLDALCKVKNLSGIQRSWLEEMEFDKGMTPPAQMAVIPRNLDYEEEFQIVWPIPPLSEIQKEQKIRKTFKFKPEKVKESELINYRVEREFKAKRLSEVRETNGGDVKESKEKPKFNDDQLEVMSRLTQTQRAIVEYLRDATDRGMSIRNIDIRETLGLGQRTRAITPLYILIDRGVAYRAGRGIYKLSNWAYSIAKQW